jgi:hypothetical protein
MDWQGLTLLAGGATGSATAIVHGILLQRRIVVPTNARLSAEPKAPSTTRRLLGPLLHFSTFAWLTGGLALVAAASMLSPAARSPLAWLVAAHYAYATVANFWATRGRHYGWMLMAAATVLIVWSLTAYRS